MLLLPKKLMPKATSKPKHATKKGLHLDKNKNSLNKNERTTLLNVSFNPN